MSNSPLKIEQIQISLLKKYAKNAKKHPETQIRKIAASITKYGFNTPILIDKENTIIAGHGRVLAAESIGWTEVPRIRIEHLTTEEVKAYRIADNKITESAWKEELLNKELYDLNTAGFDMNLSGFSEAELMTLNPQTKANSS